MLMPKASMHKNDFFPGPEYEVRISWQVLSVKPETVAKPVNH